MKVGQIIDKNDKLTGSWIEIKRVLKQIQIVWVGDVFNQVQNQKIKKEKNHTEKKIENLKSQ